VKLYVTNSELEPHYSDLAITPDEMTEILERSEDIDHFCRHGEGNEIWRKRITTIGARIYAAIFGGKPQEHLDYFREEAQLGDRDTRVRFSMSAEVSSVLFEALVKSHNGRFKVFDTPLARQVIIDSANDTNEPNQTPRRRLRNGPRGIGLVDADSLNVLVIDASDTDQRVLDTIDAPDFNAWLEEHAPKFGKLSHAPKEIRMFEAIKVAADGDRMWKVFDGQKPRKIKARINNVQILDPIALEAEAPADFSDAISRALREGPDGGGDWHIVHYVGHSMAADIKRGRAGYLILPGRRCCAPYPVEQFLTELQLGKTRFVYFSSCEFGSADVAIAAAQQQIPATLGFRWEVADDSALIFSQEFYQGLFCESLTVDEAVRDARRETEQRTPVADTTWASAVFTCHAQKWHGEKLRSEEKAG
jgi:hypothetical protein